MAKMSEYLGNIFLLIIIMQFAPTVIATLKKQYKALVEPPAYVGYMAIKGSIDEAGFYRRELKKFFDNKDIKAILLKIESPGGAAGSSEALFNELLYLKKEHPKTVVTLVENVCASGGYYIACASDYIIASQAALIGSIGVFIGYPEAYKLAEQFNVHYHAITSGKYKSAGNPLVPSNSDIDAMLQAITDDTYRQFTHDVAQNRKKLSLKNVDQWANGRIFTGHQALEKGLIDEVGSLSTAESKIKELENIEGEIEWVKVPTPSPFAKMLGAEDDSIVGESVFTRIVNTVCSTVENRYNLKMRS